MKTLTWLLIVGWGLLAQLAQAQVRQPQAPDIDVEDMLELEGRLSEESLNEQQGDETILIDNTRTRIGRDFFDVFNRELANTPATTAADSAQVTLVPLAPADSTQKLTRPVGFELDLLIITVDEVPTISTFNSIVSININDQLVWQQFVQIRRDVVETYALSAAQAVRQYIANYAETQRQLSNDADQRGSGIF